MVVMIIIVIICCGGPAHCQVLRTATDLSLDGIIAPRAVGGRLKQGKRQRQIRRLPTWSLMVSLGDQAAELILLPQESQMQAPQQVNPTSHYEPRGPALPTVSLGYCQEA